MAARRGGSSFYLSLKDRSLKLEDRLKLLRYSWKSGDVFIPNKEQVLVDILTGFLVNKKKEQLNASDVERVWECLCDVLQTRKASEPNRILLRQSSTQMLIDSLLAAKEGCIFLSPLIGCFEAVMRSDSLSAVFTLKLETMVQVMKGLCGVLAIESLQNDKVLSSVVNHSVDRFISALKTAPNQSQILQKLCDMVLPAFIGIWSAKPPDTVQKISAAIQAVLGHRDHDQYYDVYLKAKHSKSGGHIHKKAKSVEHLFSTLSKLLQNNQEQCSLYLPVIFENFIEHNCHKGIHLTVHYLMKEFCAMIGLHGDNNKVSGPIKSPVVFRTLHKLLKIIQGRELYDQTLDEKNDGVQYKFYRHVVQVLSSYKQSLDDDGCDVSYFDWYRCLTVFLQLNHHIVEPRLLEIFSIGWIETTVKEEDVEALDEMLCELITTYSKLRQVPKLITKLLGTLCVCKGNSVLQLTPRFLSCYGEVTQVLPQGIMLDVWKKLAASLRAHFVNPETKQDTGHFQGICLLFHHFLLNVKVADYTVTDITLKSVQELLVVMETEILAPLLKETIEDKDVNKLKHTLFLCQAWGEVVAMLALYTKHRAGEFQTKVLVSHEGDLSYVHGYLERKHWMKLHRIVTKYGEPSILYVWDMLIVQKVRTMLLFREVSDWSVISEAMATSITYLKYAKVKEVGDAWSGKLEDITETNLLTARWHLLSTNMAAIYTVLSKEQLKTLADVIVRCIMTCNTSYSVKNFSLHSITNEFLRSTVMSESSCLLSDVVTSVWTYCGTLFSSKNQKSSPKKKKYDAITTNFASLISVIGDSNVSWSQQMNSESLEKLQEASTSLAMIWSNTDTVLVTDLKQLQECVMVICCLPLEHLWSCDQIRCLTGLLAVKCLTDKLEDQSEHESVKEVSSDCVELCTYMLESCGLVPVFQVIDAELFLDWLLTLLESSTSGTPEFYKCLVLVEVACQAVVRDPSAVEKVASFSDKLCTELKKKQESGVMTLTFYLLQEICKLLNKPFLKDNSKETCSKMYNSLSKSVLKLSPLLESPSRGHKEGVLVRTYAVVLTTAQKDEEVQKKFLENFASMFQWCETVLKNMETTDVYTVLSALLFLQTVSKNHVLLKLQLDIEDKLRIWKLLTTVLRELLSTQSGEPVNKTYSESVNDSVVNEKQSGSKTLSQSVQESQDFQPETEKSNTKSHKKKRKSEKIKMEVDVSVSHENDFSDDITRQLIKVDRLLQGSRMTDFRETLLDSVDSRILAVESFTSEIDETVLNPVMMASLCRSLMFEGQLESQKSKVIKMQVQSVMATLLLTFDLEQFKEVLQELVDNVHTSVLYTDRGRIKSSLFIWRHLLKLEFSDEQNKIIKLTAKDMMLNFHSIVQQLKHVLSDDMVVDITLPILHAQQQMLTMGPVFLRSRSSILCLYSCLYTPLEGSTYFPAFSAVYSVLDTLLVHHADTVFQNIPAFLSCAKRLLLSVVEQSNQDKISQQPDVIKQLMACAYQMERLFSLISNHKVEFGKVAVYVVADYVTAVQKVTLLPAIKRALVPAVHKMFALCDKHAISQLHVVLSHGVTEVFKLLYKEYTRFHKYQGKI